MKMGGRSSSSPLHVERRERKIEENWREMKERVVGRDKKRMKG